MRKAMLGESGPAVSAIGLAEYRDDRPALLVHLATLQAQATEQLADLHHDIPPNALADRFTGWARAR